MLSDRCLSCPVCLSVCNVRALCSNNWTDQDETWHAGRPWTWPHCVRWGPSSPAPKGAQPPIFGPYLLRPNGCMDQDVTWYGGRPRPRRLCVRWVPSSPRKKAQPHPIFGPCLLWPKGWIKVPLGTEIELGLGHIVLYWDPALPPLKGHSPQFSGNVCCGQTAG